MNKAQLAYLKDLYDLFWWACSWAGKENYQFDPELKLTQAVSNNQLYTFEEIVETLNRLAGDSE